MINNILKAIPHIALFDSRKDAAEKIYKFALSYGLSYDVIAFLPMGGQPISDVFTGYNHSLASLPLPVKKIPLLHNPLFGIGAIDINGAPIINTEIVNSFHISSTELDESITVARKKQTELFNYYKLTANNLMNQIRGRVLIVDDGLASGYTLLAAINSLYQNPRVTDICCLLPVSHFSGIQLIRNKFKNIQIYSLYTDFSSKYVVDYFYKEFPDLILEEGGFH